MKAIEEGNINKIGCLTLIKEIWRLIEDHDFVLVAHAYRELNSCADVLAKTGCENKHFQVYGEAPDFLESLLDIDRACFSSFLEVVS